MFFSNKLNKFSHEHPSGIFLNKFQQTQIMSHFAQLHSEGNLLDDEDDDEDIMVRASSLITKTNGKKNQYSDMINDDDDAEDEEERLLKMYNDKQDLSTDEDETFPEVIEEMYNDNNENNSYISGLQHIRARP